MLGVCVERVQAGSLFERLTDLVVGRRSRDEFGVPLKIITALPEASWRVVWGSSARVARTPYRFKGRGSFILTAYLAHELTIVPRVHIGRFSAIMTCTPTLVSVPQCATYVEQVYTFGHK